MLSAWVLCDNTLAWQISRACLATLHCCYSATSAEQYSAHTVQLKCCSRYLHIQAKSVQHARCFHLSVIHWFELTKMTTWDIWPQHTTAGAVAGLHWHCQGPYWSTLRWSLLCQKWRPEDVKHRVIVRIIVEIIDSSAEAGPWPVATLRSYVKTQLW